MSNFSNYYVRIQKGNSDNYCYFRNPAPKREGLKIMPHLEQTADSGVLASGKLSIKVLPHKRTKIEMSFPPMTKAEYETYYEYIMQGMSLKVKYYNEGIDDYEFGTFYHNDMAYKPVIYGGKRMVQMEDIHLIEH